MHTKRILAAVLLASLTTAAGDDESKPFYELPDVPALASNGMRDAIERYRTDTRNIQRFFDVSYSTTRRGHLREVANAWLGGIGALDFGAMDQDDRIDFLLFQNLLRYELRRHDLEDAKREETLGLIPFGDEIVALQEARRQLEEIDSAALAAQLDALAETIGEAKERVEAGLAEDAGDDALEVSATVANRAAGEVRSLSRALSSWFDYYDGYDPLFSWWTRGPYEAADEALDDYALYLREEVAGVDDEDSDTIIGDPIGRDALISELKRELIPYTPEELVDIAKAEFAWCDREMLRASNDLGFEDDWKAALEHVKTLHVGPGEQPALVRDLAIEAVDFLEEHELVTVPSLAKNVWRMEMMSPERQKYTPFFTGGEVVSVAFPTGGMSHADKLMSMRGNNIHFSRAVVHHELIPGHHLQQFMNSRYRTYRSPFRTPFWGEGWALYWEMLLWDEDFPRSAEDRVGMLFWRMHRCARIIFSLGFQLGDMTPQECIDFLVDRVGHELANATAEVRRSVQGGYGPLYQCAYMLGGLQFRSLHRELVGSNKMTNRAFHDAILREGSIPVELVRAKLTGQELTPDFATSWRFHDTVESR
jgi:uncharacterized protein (DUF885 family)